MREPAVVGLLRTTAKREKRSSAPARKLDRLLLPCVLGRPAGSRPRPPSCWASPAGPCAQSPASWDGMSRTLWKPTNATCRSRAGCRPRHAHQSRLETFATAALGLFLPIEQSGITYGLSHDRQPEH